MLEHQRRPQLMSDSVRLRLVWEFTVNGNCPAASKAAKVCRAVAVQRWAVACSLALCTQPTQLATGSAGGDCPPPHSDHKHSCSVDYYSLPLLLIAKHCIFEPHLVAFIHLTTPFVIYSTDC